MSQPEKQATDTQAMYEAPPLHHEAAVEEPARLGPFARLTGTLLSPGETFADVNRKPTWVVPLVITILCSIAFMWFLLSHFEEGWRQFMQKAIEGQSGATPSAQDLDRAFTISKWSYLIFAGVGAVALMLATAGILSLGMMLMQAKTTFRKVLSVVSWSWAVTGLIQVAVTIASVLYRGSEATSGFNPQDMGSLSATNLGAFMPDGTAAFIKGLASAFDVFSIWFLILLTIGLAAVSGSRKIKSSSVAPMVFGLWIVSVLIRASLAAAFAR